MEHISKNGLVFEDLEVELCEYPWKHVICTSDIVKNICKATYEFHMQFKQRPLIINNELQANDRFVIADPNTYGEEIVTGGRYLKELFNYLGERYFSDKLEPAGNWVFQVCESTMVNQDSKPELHNAILHPHSDDPIQIARENRKNHEGESLINIGKIKLVLYTGDDTLNYDDYGTKLYKCVDCKLPGYDGFEMVKEINYANGMMLMWAPGPDTWHGTDFCSHLENRRIFYTGEYYEVR